MPKKTLTYLCVICALLLSGCSSVKPRGPLPEAAVEEAVENRLVHILIRESEGWIAEKGPPELAEFPLASGMKYDYASFFHPLSRSRLLVFYRPLPGGLAFGDRRDAAKWIKEEHSRRAAASGSRYAQGSEVFYETAVEGVPFYVISADLAAASKKRTRIYLYYYLPEDLKSVYFFGFSGPDDEDSDAFVDFLSILSSFKINPLEPFDEAMYRDETKGWIGHGSVLYLPALQGAAGDLEGAASMIKDGWEPHWRLANDLKLLYRAEGDKARLEAAALEYRRALGEYSSLQPPSQWLAARPGLADIYGALSDALVELGRYDEAVAALEEGIKNSASNGISPDGLRPALGRVHWERAKAKNALGDPEAARKDYEEAIVSLGQAQKSLWVEMAELYLRQGRGAEAKEAYTKALDLLKKDGGDKELRDAVEIKLKELR